MNSNKRGNSLILAALYFGLTIGSASAQTSDEGVQLYKNGKYGPALQIFEALAKKQPTNVMTHYYIALCAQGMNQTARATQEYQWVANNSRGALKTAAQNGLDSVSRYSSGRTAQIAAGAANAEAKAAATTTAAADGKAAEGKAADGKAADGKAAASKTGAGAAAKSKTAATTVAAGGFKCKTVIEFSTTWDRECIAFEPLFEATKAKYAGKISFQNLDAEAEANAAMKTKYNVSTYPTVVYLDAAGGVLKTETGRPETTDAFAEKIESFK